MAGHMAPLSKAMKNYLVSMVELGDGSLWQPESAGQWRTAEGLERRKLVRRYGATFKLLPKGYEVGSRVLEELEQQGLSAG